jgi:hypothetical protein
MLKRMSTTFKISPPNDEPSSSDGAQPPAAPVLPRPAMTVIHHIDDTPAPQKSKTSTVIFVAVLLVLMIVGVVIAKNADTKPKPHKLSTSTPAPSNASNTSGESQYTKVQNDNNATIPSTTTSTGQTKDEGNYCADPVNAMLYC